MSIQKFNLWPSPIHVIDDFLDNEELRETLKKEAIMKEDDSSMYIGQDLSELTDAQNLLLKMVSPVLNNYCAENDINFANLELRDLQLGCIYKYDQSTSNSRHWEPHDDQVENGYLTAIYYINSDYSEDHWVGGELTIYKRLTYQDHYSNTINILPKNNRLLIFPGYLIHRVKSYFGDNPRTTVVILFGLEEDEGLSEKQAITV